MSSSETYKLPLFVTDTRLVAAYDYWAGLCTPPYLPSRRDLSPTEIPVDVLPWIEIAEFRDDRIFIRLWGTGLLETSGFEHSNKFLEECGLPEFYLAFSNKMYHRVAEIRQPVYWETRLTIEEIVMRVSSRIMFPLAEDGINIDAVLTVQIQTQHYSYTREMITPEYISHPVIEPLPCPFDQLDVSKAEITC